MVYILVGIILIILLGFLISRSPREQFSMGTYNKPKEILPAVFGGGQNIKAYIAVLRHGTRYPTAKVYQKLDENIQVQMNPGDIGNLTAGGYQEMLDYGRRLAIMYPHIFGQPEKYLVFSTSVYRARQSAQACLQGIGNKDDINWGPQIDQILKINNFFIKGPSNPTTVSCQYAKLLGLNQNGCFQEDINLDERRRDRDILNSMEQRHNLALPLYQILLDLIGLCIREKGQRGYLFFAHDSTLAPLFYLLGLIDKLNYKNEEWLPFGARLEILITEDRQVGFFVNGQLKKKLSLPNF